MVGCHRVQSEVGDLVSEFYAGCQQSLFTLLARWVEISRATRQHAKVLLVLSAVLN